MSRPKAVDLFCKAGGAAMGYHRAGFEVIGVDILPQPNYPFTFIQADALTFPLDGFVLIHASPPCQHWSAGARRWGTSDQHPALIAAVRDRMDGRPYVIENITGARGELLDPVELCGTMFGLGVFRHRLFESNVALARPDHPTHHRQIGDGYSTVAGHAGGSSRRDGWTNGSTDEWRTAMGIHWMTGAELAEAIPPAYAEWIGRQIMETL